MTIVKHTAIALLAYTAALTSAQPQPAGLGSDLGNLQPIAIANGDPAPAPALAPASVADASIPAADPSLAPASIVGAAVSGSGIVPAAVKVTAPKCGKPANAAQYQYDGKCDWNGQPNKSCTVWVCTLPVNVCVCCMFV